MRSAVMIRFSALALVLIIGVVACGEIPSGSLLEAPARTRSVDELKGGTALTPSQVRRLGMFEIDEKGCGAVLLSTSAVEDKTWLLTAAHCFHYRNHPNPSVSPGECDPTRVRLLQARNDGSGQLDELGGGALGGVCVHPNFDPDQTWRHDLAVVWFPFHVDIETPYGTTMQEYYRPAAGVRSMDYAGGTDPLTRLVVFGSGNTQGDPCPGESHTTDDETVRFGVGNYEPQGHGVIRVPELDNGNSNIMYGDSGSPWLVGPYYQWASIDDWINHGAVAATTSTAGCDGGSGSSTWAGLNRSFLTSIAGDAVRFTESPWWHRICWANWCEYTEALRAALIMATLTPL